MVLEQALAPGPRAGLVAPLERVARRPVGEALGDERRAEAQRRLVAGLTKALGHVGRAREARPRLAHAVDLPVVARGVQLGHLPGRPRRQGVAARGEVARVALEDVDDVERAVGQDRDPLLALEAAGEGEQADEAEDGGEARHGRAPGSTVLDARGPRIDDRRTEVAVGTTFRTPFPGSGHRPSRPCPRR
ncbi:MAG: hypothetical protein KF878_12975 [Planctomycetes bacterium]|nr:hypothetical protein [Planctomycetota bacterium]